MIALCIGHSRTINGRTEGGAVSVGGMSEHAWNLAMAARLAFCLRACALQTEIVSHYAGSGYTSAMTWLAAHLRAQGATAAIELHFNSADTVTARGHEWLYHKGSRKGAALADALRDSYGQSFADLPDRGIKPIGEGERGALFLRLTHCPAVIAEPFFGSSPGDWLECGTRPQTVAVAMAEGIAHYLGKKS